MWAIWFPILVMRACGNYSFFSLPHRKSVCWAMCSLFHLILLCLIVTISISSSTWVGEVTFVEEIRYSSEMNEKLRKLTQESYKKWNGLHSGTDSIDCWDVSRSSYYLKIESFWFCKGFLLGHDKRRENAVCLERSCMLLWWHRYIQLIGMSNRSCNSFL